MVAGRSVYLWSEGEQQGYLGIYLRATYTAVKQGFPGKKTQYAYCTLTAEAASF